MKIALHSTGDGTKTITHRLGLAHKKFTIKTINVNKSPGVVTIGSTPMNEGVSFAMKTAGSSKTTTGIQ